jgi:hypothetical protein
MTEDFDSIDPNVQWIVAEARRPVSLDAGVRARLMEAVRSEEPPRRTSRVLGWLMEPRRFELPPLATLAAAAGLVGIGLVGGLTMNGDGRAPAIGQSPTVVATTQLPDSSAPRVMKFVLIAPQASQVSVVGDFNGWDRSATPAERQPDGSWTTWVSLKPGRHEYSFVIDEKHFVADPAAPSTAIDAYGTKNSVVVVSGAAS